MKQVEFCEKSHLHSSFVKRDSKVAAIIHKQ